MSENGCAKTLLNQWSKESFFQNRRNAPKQTSPIQTQKEKGFGAVSGI
jgi:hypothetical protein